LANRACQGQDSRDGDPPAEHQVGVAVEHRTAHRRQVGQLERGIGVAERNDLGGGLEQPAVARGAVAAPRLLHDRRPE
jgi:hypothetical protein